MFPYTLKVLDCGEKPLLAQFNGILRTDLSAILKVDLNNDQWTQAYLPVKNDGLGTRSAQMLLSFVRVR